MLEILCHLQLLYFSPKLHILKVPSNDKHVRQRHEKCFYTHSNFVGNPEIGYIYLGVIVLRNGTCRRTVRNDTEATNIYYSYSVFIGFYYFL